MSLQYATDKEPARNRLPPIRISLTEAESSDPGKRFKAVLQVFNAEYKRSHSLVIALLEPCNDEL